MTYMPSPELIELNRQMHAKGWYEGQSILPYAAKIGELIYRHDVKSVLDYGCGKGHQYDRHFAHATWGTASITRYDPAVFPIDDPIPDGYFFDMVVCTDVIEHVPENDVLSILDDLLRFRAKVVFLTISCREAGKVLADGRNAHLTVKPPPWWLYRVRMAMRDRRLHDRAVGFAGTKVAVVFDNDPKTVFWPSAAD